MALKRKIEARRNKINKAIDSLLLAITLGLKPII
jgi:hypothetical protein